MRTFASITALATCLAMAAPSSATVIDQGRFSSFEVFPAGTVTDLPCLEGTEFVTGIGTEAIIGHFVNSAEGFHFEQTEKHTGTLVPLDGGLTYVEQGNVEKIVVNGPPLGGGGVLNFTLVNNDAFVAFDDDGHRVATATIRIHELERFTGFDTNGDGLADRVLVDISAHRLDCPA